MRRRGWAVAAVVLLAAAIACHAPPQSFPIPQDALAVGSCQWQLLDIQIWNEVEGGENLEFGSSTVAYNGREILPDTYLVEGYCE